VRQLLLLERPTDKPCHTDIFLARREALGEGYRALERRRSARLAEELAAAERLAEEERLATEGLLLQAAGAVLPPPRPSLVFRAARVMWRLLPSSLRLGIARRLRNILS
jgi:hypothetical protein